MKIAIDCRMMGSGGIGSFISELIPYFLEENECLLIGNHESCESFVRLPNAQFCFCDIKPFSFKESFLFPEDILNEINHCDCYFTPYCNIPSGINIPIFSTIHDVVFLDVKELTGFLGRFVRKMFYKRAVNYSESIFTVSNFSRERILHHLHCKKPIEIVYNGISKYLTEDTASPTSEKSGILFVGNIKKHKGLKTLLDAYKIIRERNSSFNEKLIIVGNADNFRTGDEETLSRLQNLSQNEETIVFTGRISNEELKNIYSSAKVLVQPSLYEGFGIPPLEALSVGTNAIISDIPVFKEIYANLPVTFFRTEDSTDLAEKLLNLYQNPPKVPDVSMVRQLYSYRDSAKKIIEVLSRKL